MQPLKIQFNLGFYELFHANFHSETQEKHYTFAHMKYVETKV